MLDREEARAKERVVELDRRLTQFAADIEREQRQLSDADVALERLESEDSILKEEIRSRVDTRSGADERVAEAEATLAAAERTFSELTTALADLTARRTQIESNVRTHRDRLARLDQDIATVEGEVEKLAAETGGFGDLDTLVAAMESAAEAVLIAEATTQANEAAHVTARATLEASRAAGRRRKARAASGD
jgi:chromosome segregation protein